MTTHGIGRRIRGGRVWAGQRGGKASKRRLIYLFFGALALWFLASQAASAMSRALLVDQVTVSSLAGLQAAIDHAPAAGRVITLKAGTYHQSRSISIVNNGNITIEGATSDYDDTVIAGPGINDPGLWISFWIKNSDFVTLRNLTIKDTYYHAVQVKTGSDHFLADHLKTWDNGESGFKVAGPAYGSGLPYADHGTIENCLIGFSKAGQRGVVEGVDIVGAAGWDIRGNTFKNIRKAGGGPAYAAFAKGNSQSTIMEDNIVDDSFIGLSLGGGGTGTAYFRNGNTRYESRSGLIRNNILFNLDDAGIYLNKARHFGVYNNTVIDNGEGTGAVEARYPESSGTIRNLLANGPIKRRQGGTATTSNNVVNAAKHIFVDPAHGDYHLNSSAQVAISQGYALPHLVPRDIDGQHRSARSGYDIGADQTRY